MLHFIITLIYSQKYILDFVIYCVIFTFYITINIIVLILCFLFNHPLLLLYIILTSFFVGIIKYRFLFVLFVTFIIYFLFMIDLCFNMINYQLTVLHINIQELFWIIDIFSFSKKNILMFIINIWELPLITFLAVIACSIITARYVVKNI